MRRDRSEAAAADRRDDRALRLHRSRVSGSSAAATSCSSPARTCSASAPWPASGSSSRARTDARSRRRARAGRARTRRARSRRARARRACAAACRCCPAAARSRATARARAAAPSAAPTRCRSASPAAAPPRRRARRADPPARRYAPIDEALRVRRGQVLRGVDRDVDPPVEQRLLELLDEDAARADLAERPRAVAVAGRRDRDERELDPGARKAAAARSAWVSASLLPRLPTRTSTGESPPYGRRAADDRAAEPG